MPMNRIEMLKKIVTTIILPSSEVAEEAGEYASSRRARQAHTIVRLSSSRRPREFKNLDLGFVLQIKPMV